MNGRSTEFAVRTKKGPAKRLEALDEARSLVQMSCFQALLHAPVHSAARLLHAIAPGHLTVSKQAYCTAFHTPLQLAKPPTWHFSPSNAIPVRWLPPPHRTHHQILHGTLRRHFLHQRLYRWRSGSVVEHLHDVGASKGTLQSRCPDLHPQRGRSCVW